MLSQHLFQELPFLVPSSSRIFDLPSGQDISNVFSKPNSRTTAIETFGLLLALQTLCMLIMLCTWTVSVRSYFLTSHTHIRAWAHTHIPLVQPATSFLSHCYEGGSVDYLHAFFFNLAYISGPLERILSVKQIISLVNNRNSRAITMNEYGELTSYSTPQN